MGPIDRRAERPSVVIGAAAQLPLRKLMIYNSLPRLVRLGPESCDVRPPVDRGPGDVYYGQCARYALCFDISVGTNGVTGDGDCSRGSWGYFWLLAAWAA